MAWSSPRTWVTNEVVTAAHMNQEVRDNLTAGFPDAVSTVSWTPTLESSATVTSSVTGRRWRVGPEEKVWARFVVSVASSEVPAGTFFVTLPSTVSGITAHVSSGQAVGFWQARDVSAANTFSGAVHLRSSTTVGFSLSDASSGGTAITSTTPFPWDTNDVLSFQAVYPIA